MNVWFLLGVLLLVILIIIVLVSFWPAETNTSRQVDVENVAHNVGIIDTNWRDYAFYSRMYIIETISGFPGLNQTLEKLRHIRNSISEGYSVLFGKRVGDSVLQILHNKDNILSTIIHKVQSNQAILKEIQDLTNQDIELSNILGKHISQYVNREDLGRCLNKISHLSVAQIRALSDKNYSNGMTAFAGLLSEVSTLGQQLSSGIMSKAISLSSEKEAQQR